MGKRYLVTGVDSNKTRLQTIKQYESDYTKDGEWFEASAVEAASPAAAARVVATDDAIDGYTDMDDQRYIVAEITALWVFDAGESEITVKELI